MQTESLIRAIQMLSTDVANLTTNLAMTKGELDQAKTFLGEINTQLWVQSTAEDEEQSTPFVRVPVGQYQAVLRLLDTLS
jgi:hypothetical protein